MCVDVLKSINLILLNLDSILNEFYKYPQLLTKQNHSKETQSFLVLYITLRHECCSQGLRPSTRCGEVD